MTQRNASSAEELASTAEEMASQAEALQQLVSFFRVSGSEGMRSISSQRAVRLAPPPRTVLHAPPTAKDAPAVERPGANHGGALTDRGFQRF